MLGADTALRTYYVLVHANLTGSDSSTRTLLDWLKAAAGEASNQHHSSSTQGLGGQGLARVSQVAQVFGARSSK